MGRAASTPREGSEAKAGVFPIFVFLGDTGPWGQLGSCLAGRGVGKHALTDPIWAYTREKGIFGF